MRVVLRSLGLIAFVAALLIGVTPAANAATATRVDRRGDAPRFIDITRVKYGNAEHRVYSRVRVPGLERRGVARLFIAPPTAGDIAYAARVRVRANGSLDKRFTLETNTGSFNRRCHFRAQWNARDNVVLISVPQRCVKSFGGHRLYLGAITGKYRDQAPAVRRLPRG